jgi:hypothetical protein
MHPPPEALPPELIILLCILLVTHALLFGCGWGVGRATLIPLKSQLKTWKDRAKRAEETSDELHEVLQKHVEEVLD